MNTPAWIDSIDWAKGDGLVPAIVQNPNTGDVLMLGYMNEEALKATLHTEKVTFFSRKKQRLWTKGETSGHTLELVEVHLDCDQDTLLVQAIPNGPTCHLNHPSCFGQTPPPVGMLTRLEAVIASRAENDHSNSYTKSLLNEGIKRCAQKVGEEGVEVALAAVAGSPEELHEEAADLLYHLLVTLKAANTGLQPVLDVLAKRHQNATKAPE